MHLKLQTERNIEQTKMLAIIGGRYQGVKLSRNSLHVFYTFCVMDHTGRMNLRYEKCKFWKTWPSNSVAKVIGMLTSTYDNFEVFPNTFLEMSLSLAVET